MRHMEKSLKSKLTTTFFLVFSIFTILFLITEIEPMWKKILFVIFSLYTIHFMKLRYEFRSIVYETDDWKINIKPLFKKEIIGLIYNLYPENKDYIKTRNNYRIYLFIYSRWSNGSCISKCWCRYSFARHLLCCCSLPLRFIFRSSLRYLRRILLLVWENVRLRIFRMDGTTSFLANFHRC